MVDDGRAGGQVETATVSAAAVEPPGDDAAMNAGAAHGCPERRVLRVAHLERWRASGVSRAARRFPSAAVTLAARAPSVRCLAGDRACLSSDVSESVFSLPHSLNAAGLLAASMSCGGQTY